MMPVFVFFFGHYDACFFVFFLGIVMPQEEYQVETKIESSLISTFSSKTLQSAMVLEFIVQLNFCKIK